MQVDGTATYSEAANYLSKGRIALRDVDYVDGSLTLRKATLDANFELGNNRLALSRIATRLLGGQVNGEAEIRNLLPSEAAPAAQPDSPAQVTTAKRETVGKGSAAAKRASAKGDGEQREPGAARFGEVAGEWCVAQRSGQGFVQQVYATGQTERRGWSERYGQLVMEAIVGEHDG